MKKLWIVILVLTLSCSKTEPTIEKEDSSINYIKYINPSDYKGIRITEETLVTFKFVYNISPNEISSNGFQLWHTISSKKNSDEGGILNKEVLSKRKDTLEVKIYFYPHVGDTSWISTELLSMRSDKSGSVIAKSEDIPIY